MADTGAVIRDKLNEYLIQLQPLDRAQGEIALARHMLRARTEEEIHAVAPVLGLLAEALRVSTIEMLLAPDRPAFVRAAVERSGLSVDDIRGRLLEAGSGAGEELRLLGFGDPI